jgi:ERF superfamily
MGDLVLTSPERSDSMLAMIERAVSAPDFDVNKLQQLLEMRERWEANEAKKAFVAAMNAFKRNPPTIRKTKGVTLGKGADAQPAYFYAPLNQVCEIIIPALNSVGITHHWETGADGDRIVVTCVLRHELGHTERGATMKAAPDTGPGRNAIQSHGSTLTYLQRYTLLAACGLAATNGDTDGQTPTEQSSLSDERYVQLKDGIENANNVPELQRLYVAALNEAQAAKDKKAERDFSQAKNERYRQLVPRNGGSYAGR